MNHFGLGRGGPRPVRRHGKERGWSRFWAARDGIGAIEFALIAPLLLMMLLGILDFGMAFWQRMQIANATDAGVEWAMANPYNGTSITDVVQAATNLSIPTGNISPSNPYGCATSSGVVTYSQSTTCPDGSTSQLYTLVSAYICYSTLFTWPGLDYCSSSSGNCSGCTSNQISLAAQSVVLSH